MGWHGHSSYSAQNMQHFIVHLYFIEIMKVQVVLYLFLLFPGRNETWFHCYSLLNRDCLSISYSC